MSSAPETIAQPPAEQANGFVTYLKVLYAPGEAFATLARVPTWGWAAVIGIILTVLGTIIVMPATLHFIHITQEAQLAQMSADKAATAREAMSKIPEAVYSVSGVVGAVIGPWIYWLVGALIYMIGAALGGGEARFKSAWVIAVNLYIIPALGTIVAGVIVMLRGVENVNSSADLYGLPSLAMFVHGSPKLAGFLYGFNVVSIWFFIVAVIALEQVMKMGRVPAIITVAVIALLGAGVLALTAK
ncbi:MAG TPA: YIP1 family protein [Candidatus Eremiobacteraceae bacterium]|nr:YIP1 family protein [Candidatus Eremiobacteraceae bacterium]